MTLSLFFWLIAALFFLILEVGHPSLFFFLAFCFSSILSALLAYLEFSLVTQCVSFLVGFFISLGLLNLFVKRTQHTFSRTNIYALEGQKALVTEPIFPPATGQVKVNGEVWTARSLNNESLPEGTMALVVQVRGAHLIVKLID